MLAKRKEPKRKSIAMTLMRDIQGSALEQSQETFETSGDETCHS